MIDGRVKVTGKPSKYFSLTWSRPAIHSSPKFFAELLWCQLPISFPTLEFSSAAIFRFGAQDYSTHQDLHSLQNRFGNDFSVPNSPVSASSTCPGVSNISAGDPFRRQHIDTNKWSARLAGFGSPEEQFCRNSNLSLDQLCQTALEDLESLNCWRKYLAFCRSIM